MFPSGQSSQNPTGWPLILHSRMHHNCHHQDQMAGDSLLPLASELHKEYYRNNDFGKSEVLRSLLHALLIKAERVKDQNAETTVKGHWLNQFANFTQLLHNQYVETRNAQDYAKALHISYKLLNDIVKALIVQIFQIAGSHSCSSEI